MPIDDRQELTQVQGRLTTLPPDDPQRPPLQAKVVDLLRTHGERWAGPRAKANWKRTWDDVDQTSFTQQFGPVFGTDDQWEFRTGRLGTCTSSMSDFLKHGEAIRSQSSLEELTLHSIGGDGLVQRHRDRLEKLKRLNAPDVILQNELRALTRAEQCCPVDTLLNFKPLLGIKRLRFEKLGLFESELETFAGARFLQDAEDLYLYQFSDVCHEAYRKLGQLPRLRQLDFEFWSDSCGDRGIDVGGEEDARTLASSAALKNLRTLRLRYHEVGNEGMLAIVASDCLSGLQTLDLRGNYSISSAGLVQISEMPGCQRFRELNLSQCGFDNEGTLALARSPHLGNLEELDLQPLEESYESWKKISGRDFAVELSKPECLPSLRRLNISNQMIGDEGMRSLARSPRFASFQMLGLMHQGISDEGLTALATTPHPPRLRVLNLGWNPIGDAGIASLCQSPVAEGIEWLRLDGTTNTGSLLANSRFENLLELWVERLDASILEPLATSGAMRSLRKLVFRSGTSPGELLHRKGLEPIYLLSERP
jgi:hypothetical protein